MKTKKSLNQSSITTPLQCVRLSLSTHCLYTNIVMVHFQYLTDQNVRVKKIAAKGARSRRKTGGGLQGSQLTTTEQAFLAIMGGQIVVEGDDRVQEFG